MPNKKFRLVFILLFTLGLGAGIFSQVSGSGVQAAAALPAVPAGLKSTFTLGVSNGQGKTGWMTGSGAAWDARYQYLAGGVNTAGNWKTWQWDQLPPGQFALDYMNESAKSGYMPVLSWYQLLQSSPSSGGNESDRDFNNLNNGSTMNAYFSDFKLLMDKARAFGKPVIIHVEPDFWGFMQMRNANPNNLSAAVAGSGYGDVASYPNTMAGFAKALVGLRDKYAPNALLAYHISPWSSTYGDLSSSHDPNFNVGGAAQQTANFYNQLGANFNLMFYDIADRDAALYQSWGDNNHWWDVNNATYPNFNRFNQFALAITTTTGKRGMLWQVPIGNTLYKSVNNTNLHWQDNRVQYYLNGADNQHLQDLANSGIMGILFGAGGQTTNNEDVAGDGITNPNPINGNNLTAVYPDDDGGNLRLQAKAYYSRGVLSLPSTSGGTAPAPAPAPTTAPAPTPTTAPAPTSVVQGTIPATWVLSASAPGSLSAGSALNISANFTAPSGVSGNYIMDIEIFDLNTGGKVAQWTSTQPFTAGQTRTFNSTWTSKSGRYQVRLGLFNPNWQTLSWLQNGPVVQVN